MARRLSFIPYPPIERHGVIGDRRTAALVAADGTLDWLCLPDYGRTVVFGALLDAGRGGYWHLGPATPTLGHQRYLGESAVLTTRWETGEAALELTDAMAWPDDDRDADDRSRRVVLRRLRCTRGAAACVLALYPRRDFDSMKSAAMPHGGLFDLDSQTLGLWASRPLAIEPDGAHAAFRLGAGEEIWAVLAWNESSEVWSVQRAERALAETLDYWRDWMGELTYAGPRADRVRRSALTVHLLGYAPAGSLVAAPTSSLPERIGGDLNWDYRYAWVRDASLSMAVLSLLGQTRAAQRYMDWLASLNSATDSPLQVVYRVNGRTDLPEQQRHDLAGYRGSLPIRFGNRAAGQRQLDSLGYLVDCALIYLQHGGEWHDAHWEMVRRAADYTMATWRQPDSGIWELPVQAHYVSSRVMSWVALERAITIAERTGHAQETNAWRAALGVIHADVMEHGWSARLGAFRQRYGSEALDASVLLIPVMGFLPPDHPRVAATAKRIEESLTIDGFVHRFLASETLGSEQTLPLGEFEGAFLPCTFWLATTYAMMGEVEKAEAILARAEGIAGDVGAFAEEVDARSRTFLGNTPLLFSQVEYVRAVLVSGRAHHPVRREGFEGDDATVG